MTSLVNFNVVIGVDSGFDNNANHVLDVDKLIFMRQTKMLNEIMCPQSLCLCTKVYEIVNFQ